MPTYKFMYAVKLQDSLPKVRWLYHLTPKEDNILREIIVDILNKGFITPLSYPYGAEVFFVAKKDWSINLVTNY